MGHVEVLKLQHGLGVASSQGSNELVNNLSTMGTFALAVSSGGEASSDQVHSESMEQGLEAN